MIDFRKYEVGQRFKTRGGWVATLVKKDEHRLFVPHPFLLDHYMPDGTLEFSVGHDFLGFRIIKYRGRFEFSDFDLIRPILRMPAKTRRIPSVKAMPTVYVNQSPHLYQMGGGA